MKKISKGILVLLFIFSLSTLTLAANYEVDSPYIGYKTIMTEDYQYIPINYMPPLNTEWLMFRKVSLVFQAPEPGFYQFTCKIKDLKYNQEFLTPAKNLYCSTAGQHIFNEFDYITVGRVNLIYPQLSEYTERILIVEKVIKLN